MKVWSMATLISQPAVQDGRVKVWDLPLRLFHWALVVSIAVAFLSSEEDGPLNRWHMASGWFVAVLLVFRLVWGFVGGEHSRFADFLKLSALGRHIARLFGKNTESTLGHNPLGAIAIVILLGLCAVAVITGAFGGEAAEDFHEAIAWTLLAMVGLHVVAVIVMSFLERENLARAMITGTKNAQRYPDAADARNPGLAGLILAAATVAAAVFLILQYDPLAFSPRSTEASEQAYAYPGAGDPRSEVEEDD